MQYASNTPQAGAWSQASSQNQANGPPTKKVKTGGMITTKYAPPPGYVPPVPQPSPYNYWGQQQAYDAQAAQVQQYWAAYGYTYPEYTDYAAYQQYYQQYAAQGYAHPGAQYAGVATVAPQTAHPSTAYPTAWPTQSQAPNLIEQAARHRYNSAPNIHTEGSFEQYPKTAGPNDDLDESHEDYCEFTRPCYYAMRESEIVKELSIGVVNMKLAQPAHKALPATWLDANELALLPAPNDKYDSERCVSDHHSEEHKHEQLASVRETSIWDDIKDDLIFKILPPVTSDLIDRVRLRSQYRNRIDHVWLENKPNLTRSNTQQSDRRRSEQFHNGDKKRAFSQTNAGTVDDGNKRHRQGSRPPDRHENGRSFSRGSRRATHERRDENTRRKETQDEILSRLGVTGEPKPAFNTHAQSTTSPGYPNYGLDGMYNNNDITNGTTKVQAHSGVKRSYEEAGHNLDDTDNHLEKQRK